MPILAYNHFYNILNNISPYLYILLSIKVKNIGIKIVNKYSCYKRLDKEYITLRLDIKESRYIEYIKYRKSYDVRLVNKMLLELE